MTTVGSGLPWSLLGAVAEGRNVLPDATDDQAAVIEKWASGVLMDWACPTFDEQWVCNWKPDDLNPGPDCPYCADEMCARFDGLVCTHDVIERHGW